MIIQIWCIYPKKGYIGLDIQCHDIVIHLESMADIEISFGCFVHTHMEVEVDGFRIASVDVQAHLTRGGVKLLNGQDGLHE